MPKRRRGERREFNYTYTLPLRWNQEINGSVVVIPLPHDKCDLPCHVIVPKCTAERSAFGKRHNDLGDNSDCKGDALSLCAWCMLLLRKERKIERIGDWGRKREKKSCLLILLETVPLASSDKNGWFLLRALASYLPSHISLLTEEGHLCTSRRMGEPHCSYFESGGWIRGWEWSCGFKGEGKNQR